MERDTTARVLADPTFQSLVRRRRRFAFALTGVTLLAYFGYIGLIAFDKPALARPVAGGVTSWGIPVGVGLIVLTVALTAIYVARANAEFDRLERQVRDEAGL